MGRRGVGGQRLMVLFFFWQEKEWNGREEGRKKLVKKGGPETKHRKRDYYNVYKFN